MAKLTKIEIEVVRQLWFKWDFKISKKKNLYNKKIKVDQNMWKHYLEVKKYYEYIESQMEDLL